MELEKDDWEWVDILCCQGAQNIGLSNHKLKSALKCTVWSQCTPVPDKQTDRQTDASALLQPPLVMIICSSVASWLTYSHVDLTLCDVTLILRKTTDAGRRCSKTTASFISNLLADDVGFERRTQYSSLLSRHSHANNKFAFSLPRMCVQAQLVTLVFTARRSCVSAVLAVVILSVCLSHACFVTKPNNALRIFCYRTKRQSH